jgi:hypothetical protein
MGMPKATALAAIAALTANDVLTAYSGKPGCSCGCIGTYRILAANRKEAEEDSGHAHADEDVNPRQVSRVLHKVQWAARHNKYYKDLNRAPEVHVNMADDAYYVRAQVSPRRVYKVYLTKAARDRVMQAAAKS